MTHFAIRVRGIMKDLVLPFDWVPDIVIKDRNVFIRVTEPNGKCNVTDEDAPWNGRKWYLSPHSTDGEIVQTFWLAAMTAVEHEMREQFTYKGQAIFDPHYDIEKLVKLRAEADALKGRE